jgi:queuosine precursor transporter
VTAILIAVYVAAMVTANTLVWWLGPWFSPINSFLLIGLDLTLRDVMHERLSRLQLAGVIISGGLITWLANPGAAHIAIASASAFLLAALADWLTYERLRAHPWLIRSNGSNVVGAAVDSVIFPTIAFGALMPHIIALQFVAKVGGGFVWSFLLRPAVARFAR